ncbi:MAG: hypothetical protein KJ799_17465 [Bacteroidetes bacterium]|nr:hypothetical protein [Bacteroidota bacterium]
MTSEFLSRVPGQNKSIEILEKFIDSENIPHSLLFVGPSGIGKFFTAVQFAKELNCGENSKPSIKKKISSLEEPYVKYVFPLPRGKNETSDDSPTAKLSEDALEQILGQLKLKRSNPYHKLHIDKANNIKISSIRDIKKFLSLNYDDIKYRLVVIDDAHLMNDEAQNALLKSLEEPPAGVVFILCTDNENLLLPTIKSRSWRIPFSPQDDSTLTEILTTYFSLKNDSAKKISLFSDGTVDNAVNLLENDFDILIEKSINILRYSLGKRYNSAFTEIESIYSDNNPRSLQLLIQIIIKWFSDTVRDKVGLEKVYFEKYSDTIEKFNSKFIDTDVYAIQNRLDSLKSLFNRNINLNLIIANIIFEIGYTGIRK